MKLKLIILLFLAMALNSCGLPLHRDLIIKRKGEVRQFSTTNPSFSNIVTQFVALGKQYSGNQNFNVGDVPVNFGNTEDPSFEGVCFSYSDGTTEVIIKESWWVSASQSLKESLLFHELGHCALGRDHDDETIKVAGNTYKTSIMNSVIVNPTQYDNHRAGYLTELFTQSKTTLIEALSP